MPDPTRATPTEPLALRPPWDRSRSTSLPRVERNANYHGPRIWDRPDADYRAFIFEDGDRHAIRALCIFLLMAEADGIFGHVVELLPASSSPDTVGSRRIASTLRHPSGAGTLVEPLGRLHGFRARGQRGAFRMAVPVQITFRDIPHSPAVSAHVERRAEKLETFFARMSKCHVVVEEPHRHKRQGKKYQVEIDMHVPGRELVISRNPEDSKEDLHATIDIAFDDAERVLEDYARQLQPDTKTRMTPPRGVIVKIFHDRGYGFIGAEGDGHEVYFHRNSIVGEKFERLTIGTKVRFAEEDGDKGPQASTVYLLGTS
jgi:ribosomal subunit interface protein